MTARKKSRGLYARVMGDWHSHPKVLACSMEARGLWVTLASWCCEHRMDGAFTARHAAALAQGKHAKPLKELVSAGLVDVTGDGSYRLHDWSHHNMTRAEHDDYKAAEAERKRSKRDVGKGETFRADNGRKSGGHPAESLGLGHAHKEGSYPSERGDAFGGGEQDEDSVCAPWWSEEAAQ